MLENILRTKNKAKKDDDASSVGDEADDGGDDDEVGKKVEKLQKKSYAIVAHSDTEFKITCI